MNRDPTALSSPEFHLGEQDKVLIIGAAGFTAKNLYLPHLQNMGVVGEQMVLVDVNEEQLHQVQVRTEGAFAYTDTTEAIVKTTDQGSEVAAIFIASSTSAHASNIQSIVELAKVGKLDLEKVRIWCEKPVTQPDIFDEIKSLADEHGLDISVGYILRFSHILTELERYLDEHQLSVTGLDWTYGKDRTMDTRPSQGVYPDEVVHPLSVTDLVLTRALGEVVRVEVGAATIQSRPFVNQEVQNEARAINPDLPKNPTSDVEVSLQYKFNNDGSVSEVPVTISSSFLFREERRQVTIAVRGPNGPDKLIVNFDERTPMPNGSGKFKRVDSLRAGDGTIIHEWSGDKAAEQLVAFLGRLASNTRENDQITSLEGEARTQRILSAIGRAALQN